MQPLPHRIRRLTFRVKASSQAEAFALRKELRDHLESALLGALERCFDEIAPGGEVVHIPRLELEVTISGVEDVAERLPGRVQREMRTQLSAMLTGVPRASTSGLRGPEAAKPRVESAGNRGAATPYERSLRDEHGLQIEHEDTLDGSPRSGARGARDAGAEDRGGLGEARPAGARGEPATDRVIDVAPSALVRMLVQYLDTGALPWPLANLDLTTVLSTLRSAASDDPAAVVDQMPPDPGDFGGRAARWIRWFQLVPEARWALIAKAVGARSSGERGTPLAEIVASLASEQAASLSRAARLQLAAAAVTAARMGIDGPGSGELASTLLRALGDGGGQVAGESLITEAGSGRAVEGADAVEQHGRALAPLGENVERSLRVAMQRTTRLPEPARTAFQGWLAAGGGAGDPLSLGPSGTLGPPSGEPTEPRGAWPLRGPAPARVPQLEERSTSSGGPSRAHAAQVAAMRRDRLENVAHPRSAGAPASEGEVQPFGHMVHHAGLVLLHPFLSRLFECTGIKDPGRRELTPAMLPRAAALLHQLATGEEEVYELSLGFIKILVGLEPDAPLPLSGGLLSTADRDEVDALLAAVIEHWPVLKSTSAQGLRGAFLQRRGLLRRDEQGFRLQVEPAPFDMLLGQLPWGIGVVKLPWMKKAIFTDWPTP